MAHRLVETENRQYLLRPDNMSQHPPISIYICFRLFRFLWRKIWRNDGFEATTSSNSHFLVVQWHFMHLVWILRSSKAAILLINTGIVKWTSSVITMCSQKSGSTSNIRAIVWPHFKRRVWSGGNIICINCTLYGKKANHSLKYAAKCFHWRQNTKHGDYTTDLGPGQRSLW